MTVLTVTQRCPGQHSILYQQHQQEKRWYIQCDHVIRPKSVVCCLVAVYVLTTPFGHRGIIQFFLFLHVTEALKHFRVVSVTKLSNCRVPSSGRERAIQTNYKHKFPVIKSRS